MTAQAVPQTADAVEVRRRHWVVREVVGSSLPKDPLRQATNDVSHVVRLSSMDDDGWGEELEVIWEIEPGARVVHHGKPELPRPDGFDDPESFSAFLDAVRWGTVSSADASSLQSPFRSGVTIENYQLEPVVRAIRMPRVNLLIADDVGLGKTIEAGLVLQELLLRHRIQNVLVVCPASLNTKWKDEMREKFGLEFEIVDSDAMKRLRRERGLHVNPWTHFPRLITSMDYLKREMPLRLFRETLPGPNEPTYPRRHGLLIVDEAHNIAPSGSARYAIESQRTDAIRTLAPHFEHKLFLSATPHNGFPESFSALLNLLDDQRFTRGVRRQDPKQVQAVMVRRLKTELVDEQGKRVFLERQLEAIPVRYTDEEKALYQDLKKYGDLRRAAERESTGARSLGTDFVLKLLKKRLFSSPQAFADTLDKHVKTLRGFEEKTSSRRAVPEGVLRRQLEAVEEPEETTDDEHEEELNDAVVAATNTFDELGDEERRLLQTLSTRARQAANRPDSKTNELLRWLEATLRPGGKWNDERVIVFTEFRATQKWLQGILAAHQFATDERLELLYGGMKEDDRERIKAAFQAHPSQSKVRILLATDMASEGIDLQNHCHRLVHFEIPWNPNVLEQRNGRIDRHGQRFAPEILHFVGSNYRQDAGDTETRPGDLEGDLEFLMVAVKKIERIGSDLLGKVSPVVAKQVLEAMLGKRREIDTSRTEKEAEPVRRLLSFQRKLADEIAKLRRTLDESREELHVTPASVRRVVDVGLRLAKQPPLRPFDLHTSSFVMPKLTGAWVGCLAGLPHPHTKKERPITFDHDAAKGRDDVVLVHLNHRLVDMSQRLLRAEVSAAKDARQIHRVVACTVPTSVTKDLAVLAWSRILVLGADGHRLHEQVIVSGGYVNDGRFRRFDTVEEATRIERALSDRAATEAQRERIRVLWSRIEKPLGEALQSREQQRTKNLHSMLEDRAEDECRKVEAIFAELKKQIETELGDRKSVQLEMFTSPEQAQWDRDAESLHDELKRIPDRLRAEQAELRRRFRDPKPWSFPVAVAFLVPQSW
jgi:superfamily II DNA or RNA helicase